MKLVLITGATKGIGRSTAIAFANSGWDLILIARNIKMLKELKDELSNTGRNINIAQCDLSYSDQIVNVVSEVIRKCGCPSVLINNAGFAYNGDLLEMSRSDWERVIQVNLTSVFEICKIVVPFMRNKGGVIINVSSHAANNAFSKWGAYCVSKAALSTFTKCLREEERLNSIKACTITLGSGDTPLWDSDSVSADFDRNSMLSSVEVAKNILHIAEQPSNQIIEDLTLMPAGGAF